MNLHNDVPITVYSVLDIGEIITTCAVGVTHTRKISATKVLGPVIGMRTVRFGYGPQHDMDTPLRADRQGRVYHCRPPMDFGGRTLWLRDGDKVLFESRLAPKTITLGEALGIVKRIPGTTVAFRAHKPQEIRS